MSTINKNSKVREESVNQRSSSSFLSNYRWWLLSLVLIVLVAVVAQRLRSDPPQEPTPTERFFTADELRTFTKDKLYLAILGHVFNVSSAPRFYSSTGGYGYYTGRDASRSFHTGGTSAEDLTDDLTGLSDEAMSSIYDWLKFYQKQYPEIGKVIGRFFASNRSPTEQFARVLAAVDRMKKKDEEKARLDQQLPPCNSEWSHTSGKRVWCSDKSGGVERSWVGVPRRFFESRTQTERCVCLENPSQIDGRLKEYPDCPSTSFECQIAN